MIRILCLAASAALAATGAARAHVVMQPAQAPPGQEATLTFVVGHGCNDRPTTALRVELPAGVRLVAAEPKAGWTVAADQTSVTWRGELAAHQTEGFALRARLPATAGRLAFAAVQTCGDEVVRWDQAYGGEGPKPARPAPAIMLAAGAQPRDAGGPAAAAPSGVTLQNGAFADAAGKPLYTFNFDTMVGMSHCEGDCAKLWPPLIAPKGARASGDWSLVTREDGALQWAYKTKPLYTYAADKPGGPPTGLAAPNWTLAKPSESPRP